METCQCLNCEIIFNKRKKSSDKNLFCSRICSNIQKGKEKTFRTLLNSKKSKICKECNTNKQLNYFSFIDKYNYKMGKRDICKRCSANLIQTNRRNKTWKDDARTILFNGAKQRSKNKKLEFNLIKEDILIPDKCPIFGFPLKREARYSWMFAPSLDRIDNSKGYTKDNIIVISRRANILKKDATFIELKQLSDFYLNLSLI